MTGRVVVLVEYIAGCLPSMEFQRTDVANVIGSIFKVCFIFGVAIVAVAGMVGHKNVRGRVYDRSG